MVLDGTVWRRFFYIIGLFLLCSCGSHEQSLAPVVNGWQALATKQGVYRVKSGDTLYSIAWRYALDFRELARWNKIPSPYHLHIGQKIYLTPVSGKFHLAKKSPSANIGGQRYKQSYKPQPITRRKSSSLVSNITKKRKMIQASPWVWPTKGQIVCGFSYGKNGNKGIDIKGKMGQNVVACAAGEVVYSGSGLCDYGKLIIIKHNATYLSAYAHNKKLLVKEGDKVKIGEKIAEMGNTGSSVVMLHFELRRAGRPVNPLNYLPKRTK